jgi:hypothetical protein
LGKGRGDGALWSTETPTCAGLTWVPPNIPIGLTRGQVAVCGLWMPREGPAPGQGSLESGCTRLAHKESVPRATPPSGGRPSGLRWPQAKPAVLPCVQHTGPPAQLVGAGASLGSYRQPAKIEQTEPSEPQSRRGGAQRHCVWLLAHRHALTPGLAPRAPSVPRFFLSGMGGISQRDGPAIEYVNGSIIALFWGMCSTAWQSLLSWAGTGQGHWPGARSQGFSQVPLLVGRRGSLHQEPAEIGSWNHVCFSVGIRVCILLVQHSPTGPLSSLPASLPLCFPFLSSISLSFYETSPSPYPTCTSSGTQ